MADECVLLLVSDNVNCKILLTLILCYSIAVKMDGKPIRVKEENCDNEGEKVQIPTGRDFGGEEATTTAANGVKRGGGLIFFAPTSELGQKRKLLKIMSINVQMGFESGVNS